MNTTENVLFLDVNREYINPSSSVIRELLEIRFTNVYIFGPGYVSSNQLHEGVEAFIKNKNIEVVITTEYVFFSDYMKPYLKSSIQDSRTSFISRFEISDCCESIFKDMNDYFKSYLGHKYLFMLQTDYYNIKDEYLFELERQSNMNIVGFGSDLVTDLSDLPYVSYEQFYPKVNNKWLDFCNQNVNRIISTPHFLSMSELNFRSIDSKQMRVSLSGVGYWFRKEVFKNLSRSAVKIHKPRISQLLRIMMKLGLNVLGNKYLLNLYKTDFIESISNSKIAFTCGSGLKWPLRKFFEIPAQGTILICYPFKSANDWGFKSWENCIFVESPDQVLKAIEYLQENPAVAEKIAYKGYQLVKDRHSTKAKLWIFDKLS